MMKKKISKSRHSLLFFLFLGMTACPTEPVQATENISHPISYPDSVGTEIIDGNRYIIHKLSPKETYYQLSRIYNVPVQDIIQANNSKNLRIGDTAKIPRGKNTVQANNSTPGKATTQQIVTTDILTEYKVGKNETLYAISKRFSISVDGLKMVNNLNSDVLREGQTLKIPNTEPQKPEPIPVQEVPVIVTENQPIDDSDFKANKYGIREKQERGLGTWMDSLGGEGQTSLALHKTAPIGTILKITNPMNKNVTFAKVVGKFGDNQDTQGAIVVLSKSVATALGLLDRRFLIELNYGAPLE